MAAESENNFSGNCPQSRAVNLETLIDLPVVPGTIDLENFQSQNKIFALCIFCFVR